jgi:transposase-like protein
LSQDSGEVPKVEDSLTAISALMEVLLLTIWLTTLTSQPGWPAKQRHLNSWRSSGTTQIACCQKHGISRHAFQYWKHQLDNGRASRFVEAKKPLASGVSKHIEILLVKGVRICVPQGASPEELRMVLHVLREQ